MSCSSIACSRLAWLFSSVSISIECGPPSESASCLTRGELENSKTLEIPLKRFEESPLLERGFYKTKTRYTLINGQEEISARLCSFKCKIRSGTCIVSE